MRYFLYIYFAVSFLLLACCQDHSPKPSGFFRIDLPAHQYTKAQEFDSFQFDHSQQAILSKAIQKKDSGEHFNINYPRFNAQIFCSSFPIKKEKFAEFSEESRKFVYLHTLKADAIQEKTFVNKEQNVYGLVYNIRGNVASPTQFTLTDSINSFFRGALYFNSVPNQDSIAPVLEYINHDIQVLIESFQWKR